MLQFLLFFFISSICWASKLSKSSDLLDFLSTHPEKTINSTKEKINQKKCHEMFNANPDFNSWQKAITDLKKAKNNLLVAKEIAQKAQKEFHTAKKTRKKLEKEVKSAPLQTYNQIIEHFQTALLKETTAVEEKESAKQRWKEAKKAYKQAKLDQERKEENFKKSIPNTFSHDFEDLALKQFKNFNLQSNR